MFSCWLLQALQLLLVLFRLESSLHESWARQSDTGGPQSLQPDALESVIAAPECLTPAPSRKGSSKVSGGATEGLSAVLLGGGTGGGQGGLKVLLRVLAVEQCERGGAQRADGAAMSPRSDARHDRDGKTLHPYTLHSTPYTVDARP